MGWASAARKSAIDASFAGDGQRGDHQSGDHRDHDKGRRGGDIKFRATANPTTGRKEPQSNQHKQGEVLHNRFVQMGAGAEDEQQGRPGQSQQDQQDDPLRNGAFFSVKALSELEVLVNGKHGQNGHERSDQRKGELAARQCEGREVVTQPEIVRIQPVHLQRHPSIRGRHLAHGVHAVHNETVEDEAVHESTDRVLVQFLLEEDVKQHRPDALLKGSQVRDLLGFARQPQAKQDGRGEDPAGCREDEEVQ